MSSLIALLDAHSSDPFWIGVGRVAERVASCRLKEWLPCSRDFQANLSSEAQFLNLLCKEMNRESVEDSPFWLLILPLLSFRGVGLDKPWSFCHWAHFYLKGWFLLEAKNSFIYIHNFQCCYNCIFFCCFFLFVSHLLWFH